MWRLHSSLTPTQLAQVDAMFPADEHIRDFIIVSPTEYRRWFGYFVDDTGDMDGGSVVCRRQLALIRNWRATSHLEE